MSIRWDVPFVTQHGDEDNANDCGLALIGSIANAFLGLNLDVVQVTKDTGVTSTRPLHVNTVRDEAYDTYGIRLLNKSSGTLAWLRERLDSGQIAILLINRFYLPFYPKKHIPHFVLAVGYNDDSFIIHDPLLYEGYKTVPDADLRNAWQDPRPPEEQFNTSFQALYTEASLMPKLKGAGWNTQTLFVDNLQAWIDSMKANPPATVVCVEFPARAQLVHEALAPLSTKVFFRKYFDGNGALVFPHGSAWHTLTLDELEAKFADSGFTAQAVGMSPRERAIQFAIQGYDLNIEETIDELAVVRTQIEHLSTRAQTAEVAPLGDDNSWNKMSPETWWNAYLPYKNAAYGWYCDNEPAMHETQLSWAEAILDKAIPVRQPIVYCNYSVGTPNEHSWHIADRFLRKLSQHRAFSYLGLHEYIPTLATYEFGKQTDPAQFPLVAKSAKPYLTGRFRWLSEYCRTNPTPFEPPNIIITEAAWDSIDAAMPWQRTTPGYESGAGYQIIKRAAAAWKPANWTIGQYTAYQLKWLWEQVYKPFPEVIGWCLFTFNGAGVWRTNYRFEGENDFMAAIKQYDFSAGEGTINPPATRNMTLVDLDTTLNVRAGASTSAPILGVVRNGDTFIPTEETAQANGYTWRKGETKYSPDSWLAVQGGTWTVKVKC